MNLIWDNQGDELSSDLLSFVKGVESYSPKAYSDYGQYSIGWGTRARDPGEIIDEDEAERRLREELSGHYQRISNAAAKVGADLSPRQLDALTSFDYNTGDGAMLVESSGGDASEIARRLPSWNKVTEGGRKVVSNGLVNRRGKEIALFASNPGQPDLQWEEPGAEPEPTPEGQTPSSVLVWDEGTAPNNSMRVTETPVVDPAEDKNPFIEFGARVARGAQSGLAAADIGIERGVAEATREARNPYVGETPDVAAGDIPVLEQSLAKSQEALFALPEKERRFSPIVAEIPKLATQLAQAREAATGTAEETPLGMLSKAAEGHSEALKKKQLAKAQEWAPLISEARDTTWGMQLAESIGNSIPSTASAMVNPLFGLSVMYAQQYDQSRDEFAMIKAQRGEKIDPEEQGRYAFEQAIAQTPWEVVGDVAMARGIKQVFRMLPRNAVEAGATTFGKWLGGAAKAMLPGVLGETLITTPAQSLTQDVIAEQHGLQAPTSIREKLGKIPRQQSIALAQTVAMGGLPVSVAAGVKAARGDFAAPPTATPPAAEVPAGTYKDFSEIPRPAPLAPVETAAAPTSDADLARMQAAYESENVDEEAISKVKDAFGLKARVDRQSRSEVFESIKNQPSFKELPENDKRSTLSQIYAVADEVGSGFKAIGVPVKVDLGARAAAGVSFDNEGKITFTFNPIGVLDQEKHASASGIPSMMLSRMVNGEELIHAAHLVTDRAEWLQLPEQARTELNFQGFVHKKARALLDDMEQTISDAPAEESQRLMAALDATYQTYFGHFNERTPPTTSDNIFSLLRDASASTDEQDRHMTPHFMAEFLRQATQMKKQGFVTEDVFAKLYAIIAKWVKPALARLRVALPGAFEGKFGTKVQQKLSDIEKVLAGEDVGNPIFQAKQVEAVLGQKPAVVNIGLATNDGKGITSEQAIDALKAVGVDVQASEVKQSGTEPTLVATLSRPLTPAEADKLSADLNQEAIAQKVGDVGELYGPGAENWRPFNDEFFLTPTEKTYAAKGDGLTNSARAYIQKHNLSPEVVRLARKIALKDRRGRANVNDITEARSQVESGDTATYSTKGVTPSAVGPTVKRVRNPIITTSVSLGGEKTTAWHNPIGDLSRFYNGTADIFEKSPGFEFLGRAIRKHVDKRRAYYGRFTEPFRRVFKDKEKTAQAVKEFEEYWEAHERGNQAAANVMLGTMSPTGKAAIEAWKKVADQIGDINQAKGVQVFDPKINSFRPIGKIGQGKYFPRVIKPHVMEILRDPTSNPAAWQELKHEMIAAGYISQANADAEMQAYVDQLSKGWRSNDHFGAIELARSMPLPNKAYDYSFETVRKYVARWSERISQIEAFGQKVGKEGKDLFDRAQEIAGDQYTKEYIRAVQDRAYNVVAEGPVNRMLVSMNEVATGLQLGNPVSSSRNWISGMAFTAQHFGVGRMLRSLTDLKTTFQEIESAYERGILSDDLMNIMQDGEQVAGKRSKTAAFANVALKLSGFNAAETWVRGVNVVAARALLRDAITANQKSPLSRESRGYRGYFQRLGLRGHDMLLNEGGAGPRTDEYLRAAVNELQGGYTYDQVPAFMDSPVGRFMFKYQKWGSQQLRHFDREVVKPAIRAISAGQFKQEEIVITNADGSKTKAKVPGDLMPLVRYLFILTAAGAGMEWLLEQLFGIPQKTASIAQILSRMKTDKVAAFGQMMNKLWGYQLQAGSMGLLGNYLQVGKDFTERTRFKNPLNPPGLAPMQEVGYALLDMWSQGNITGMTVDSALKRISSAYRTGGQMLARGQDVMGTEFRPLLEISRQQDRQWLRSVTQRYNDEIGVRFNRNVPARVSKNPMSAFRDGLKLDLLVGDSRVAAQRIQEAFAKLSPDRAKLELRDLKASIKASQPVRAGAGGGEAMRANFLEWARKNLSRSELARIREVDETYRRTAIGLGLMTGEPVDEEDMAKAMERIRLKAEK